MTMFDDLKAPFPPDRVSWRIGSTTQDKTRGLAMAYMDARDVMERLDAVCGPAGWQNRYSHANGKTVCDIGIKADGEWIWKADGAGDTDIEAEKGALSDAFKRAAVRWGIGRYLYDVVAPWVSVVAAGKSFKIADGEYAKLTKLLGAAAPAPPPKSSPAPSNAALDSAAIASDLIRDLRALVTASGLRTFSETIKAKVEKLEPADRERVRGDYERHMKSLKENERAAA